MPHASCQVVRSCEHADTRGQQVCTTAPAAEQAWNPHLRYAGKHRIPELATQRGTGASHTVAHNQRCRGQRKCAAQCCRRDSSGVHWKAGGSTGRGVLWVGGGGGSQSPTLPTAAGLPAMLTHINKRHPNTQHSTTQQQLLLFPSSPTCQGIHRILEQEGHLHLENLGPCSRVREEAGGWTSLPRRAGLHMQPFTLHSAAASVNHGAQSGRQISHGSRRSRSEPDTPIRSPSAAASRR